MRPVLLRVDGHGSHIDVEVSKFCLNNGTACPLIHSHILQPLDVGGFRSLKSSWSKECSKYRAERFGVSVTTEVFSEVFRDAWLATVRMSLFVTAFMEA